VPFISFYSYHITETFNLHIIATFTHKTTLNINIDHESLGRNLRPGASKKKDPVFKPGLLIKVWRNPSNEIDLRTLTFASY
jgi:hypothetical protein